MADALLNNLQSTQYMLSICAILKYTSNSKSFNNFQLFVTAIILLVDVIIYCFLLKWIVQFVFLHDNLTTINISDTHITLSKFTLIVFSLIISWCLQMYFYVKYKNAQFLTSDNNDSHNDRYIHIMYTCT
jgi:hypothetical protein